MGDLSIEYWLPVSVVRVTGQKHTVKDLSLEDSADQQRIETELTAQLLVQADPEARRGLTLTDDDFSDTAAAVTFSPDGRLLSIDASTEGQGEALVKASVSLGGAVLGAVLAFHNPVAAAAVASAVAGATQGGRPAEDKSARFAHEGNLEEAADSRAEMQTPLLTPGYERDHPAEAQLLRTYHNALAKLLKRHATAADEGDLGCMRELAKLLRLTRAEASLLEDHYQSWLAKQVVRTGTEIVEWDCVIDQLPTEKVLRERLDTRWIAEGAGYSDEVRRQLQDAETNRLPWAVFARDQGIAVSVDYLNASRGVASPAQDRNAIQLSYRRSRPARIRTWVVEKVRELETRDGGGNERILPAHYRVRLARTEHRMVVSRLVAGKPNEATVALPRGAFRKGDLTVTFDEHGGLASLGTKRPSTAGGLASTAGHLPAALQGGVEAGSTLVTGLVSGSSELAQLGRKLEIAKAQKELNGLTSTKQADPTATALQKLEGDVREAELKARLAQATAEAAAPTPGVLFIRVVDTD